MPSARIITHFPQAAQELTKQLRSRGFAVELISPEDIADTSTSADLVIRLDECSVEEALATATRIGDRNTNVFVAPGAITGERPPIEPVAAAVNQGAAQSAERFSDAEWHVAGSESATAGQESQASIPNQPEVYVYQDAMLSPLERLRLPQMRLPKFALPRLRLPRIAAPKFSLPRVRVPRIEVPKFSFPHLRLRRIQIPSISLPQLRLPRFAIPRPAFRIPRMTVRIPRTSLRLPKMDLRLPRPHLLIETANLRGFYWKKIVADFSILKLRLSSVKFQVPKQALRVPQINWRTPQLHLRKLPLACWRDSIPSPSLRGRFSQSSWTGASRVKSPRFWDTAIAFGILAVSVLMVGGLLHSKTPLPARLTQQSASTGQRLPFADVKPAPPVGARAASTGNFANAPRVATPDITAQAKPSPKIIQPAAKLSHLKSKRRVSTGQVNTAQRGRASESHADYVADDVVVHYAKKN